jgi:hypothetical protein
MIEIPMRLCCCAQKCRTSEIIVTDILKTVRLPAVFQLLNHIRTKNFSDPVDKFTDRELKLFSHIIEINSREKLILLPANLLRRMGCQKENYIPIPK